MNRNWLLIIVALLATLPAVFLRVLDPALSPGVTSLVYGGGIIAGAFLLTWAAEVAEMDISQALALAFVAFIAVLPEYAVDLVFAWKAGIDPQGEYVHYATANMTGANRLLVGIGWPLVALLFWLRRREGIHLRGHISLELLVLAVATIYAFTIPFKGSIALWDAAILISLFAFYIWLSATADRGEEPTLVGPASAIAGMGKRLRRITIVILFLVAAGIILSSAEPFAEGLLEVGTEFGIDKFIMVQWVAPLASEAPEILVAIIFTLKGNAAAAMTALISSKVNQWTLLVGTLPITYGVSSSVSGHGFPMGLPLDGRQVGEILLTAGQSLFAVVLLARLHISWKGALTLLLLWSTQLLFTSPEARYIYLYIYLGLALALVAADRGRVMELVRSLSAIFNGIKGKPQH